jgi:hypothetical protein
MKLIRFVVATLCLAGAVAVGQTPTITSIQVQNTGCTFTAGSTSQPCFVGPGMVLVLTGQNFGQAAGGVSLCDCPFATIIRWTPTRISATLDEVVLQGNIMIEAASGASSNSIPYAGLAPVIGRIEVNGCSFVPNVSTKQCVITPGAQVTVYGSYFGRYAGQVSLCDCESNATIDSWNPNWVTDPQLHGNTIVVTAVDAVCGASLMVQAGGMWSNPVPYTTCGS